MQLPWRFLIGRQSPPHEHKVTGKAVAAQGGKTPRRHRTPPAAPSPRRILAHQGDRRTGGCTPRGDGAETSGDQDAYRQKACGA